MTISESFLESSEVIYFPQLPPLQGKEQELPKLTPYFSIKSKNNATCTSKNLKNKLSLAGEATKPR